MSAPTNPWTRLYGDVKVHIPGVVDAVMAQVAFSLFKDFCDKTNLWTEVVPIPVDPDHKSYAFSVNDGAPNRLLLVYDPAQEDPNRKWVQGNMQMQAPGVLTVSYPPSTATTWNAVVAKTPLDVTDEGYPDIDEANYWIVDKYREALTYGILGRLQYMPGKPYSNDAAGKRNNQVYIAERSKARTDGIKANTFGGQRWMFPQGFATVTRKGWT